MTPVWVEARPGEVAAAIAQAPPAHQHRHRAHDRDRSTHPFSRTLWSIIRLLTPSKIRRSAVVANVEFWNVLPVMLDSVRLKA